MTPEEFEPIAVWMGWEKRRLSVCSWWENAARADLGTVETKTSLTPAECYEALERLVGKGYDVDFSGWRRGGQKQFAIKVKGRDIHVVIALTQHEAIEAAILALVEAKGGEEPQ